MKGKSFGTKLAFVKKTKQLLFIFCVVLNSLAIQAQEFGSKFRLDTRINGLVPHPLSNKALTNTFVGVYTVSGSENIHLFREFFVGIHGENSVYKVPTNKIVATNGYRLSDLFQLNSVGLNVGYDYYFSATGFLSTSVSLGESFGKFTAIEMVKPVPVNNTFNAGYVQVTSNINFTLEDHMGIGFLVSYTYVNYSFNPYDIALNQFRGYSDSDVKGAISHIEVGFNLFFAYVKKNK